MLSTFLGILTPNCSRAVAILLVIPDGCGDQRVDLALEEAGLTPGLAESTLLVGSPGDTQGAWLRDESPVAWDETDSLHPQLAGGIAEMAAASGEAGEHRAKHLLRHISG